MFLYFRRFFCLIRLENLLKIMSLRLCLFYVFRVRHKKSRAVERKIVGRFRVFCICQTV